MTAASNDDLRLRLRERNRARSAAQELEQLIVTAHDECLVERENAFTFTTKQIYQDLARSLSRARDALGGARLPWTPFGSRQEEPSGADTITDLVLAAHQLCAQELDALPAGARHQAFCEAEVSLAEAVRITSRLSR